MDRSLQVAIADDNASFQHQLKTMVEALGHQVAFVAKTGRELVDQCLALRPDVVVSDIRMPDMDGLEAAKIIHMEAGIPVILVSASCDRDLVLRAEQTHVLCYLVKPLAQDSLVVALNLAMQQSQANASATLDVRDEEYPSDGNSDANANAGKIEPFDSRGMTVSPDELDRPPQLRGTSAEIRA